MCGISGFYPAIAKDDSVLILRRMLTRIRHRGPDQSGLYVSKQIAMGSVRLSIIDLATGTMPLSNADGTLWIVFNGEIFNYIELRKQLQAKGHIFRTTSDTEVVLHLYEEYGPDCLKKLNGQFAIAIWNSKTNELFLARDRVGIRPIFYTSVKGRFIFASEIKALLEFPGIRPTISSASLAQVFTFWTPVSPNTIFDNIFEVPPGYYVLVNSSGIRKSTYWELPLNSDFKKRNFESTLEEFEHLFNDAVRIRLRADVPVGAYLSGGIDSSVTTSVVKSINPDKLRTFSIGFKDKEFDETSFQSIAVKYLNTEHTYLQCRSRQIADSFSDVVWHSEMPLLRTAPGPMYLLSEVVKKNGFKVVITGEGADELLGGYDIFKEALIRQLWAKDPNSKVRPALLKQLYPFLPQMNNANITALKLFYGYQLEETNSPVYSHLLRWHNTSRIKNYLSDEIKTSINGYDPVQEISDKVKEKFSGVDLLTRAQWLEMKLFMSGYLLSAQGDRVAMANSVEGRYPFLDYRVIEFCMQLPPEYKIHGLNEKILLKKMMDGKLPEQIIRRPKQSYRAPIAKSFYGDHAPDYVKEMLSEQRISHAGIFDPGMVNRLSSKMKKEDQVSEIDNMALAGVLSTQLLYNQFVVNSMPALKEDELICCTLHVFND